eukprot:948871-Prorocentrum_minimum.AAC.1
MTVKARVSGVRRGAGGGQEGVWSNEGSLDVYAHAPPLGPTLPPDPQLLLYPVLQIKKDAGVALPDAF